MIDRFYHQIERVLEAKQELTDCKEKLEYYRALRAAAIANNPASRQARDYHEMVDIAESATADAELSYTKQRQTLFCLPTEEPTDSVDTPLRADKAVVCQHLWSALQTAIDLWDDLPQIIHDEMELSTLQSIALHRVLTKLGVNFETLAALNTQTAMVLPVQHVTHYKGGHYLTLGEGIHTETDEAVMLYATAQTPQRWFARPLAMFHDVVALLKVKRFTPRVMPPLLPPVTPFTEVS